MVTANGLLRILVMLAEGKAFSRHCRDGLMDILHGQEFNQGICSAPKGARVPTRLERSRPSPRRRRRLSPETKPYVLVILTEWYCSSCRPVADDRGHLACDLSVPHPEPPRRMSSTVRFAEKRG